MKKMIAVVLAFAGQLLAESVTVGDREFTVPEGFHLESAVEDGLTERPIVVDLDEYGHLYVAESSGTNDNVQKQLREKPHSILRLTDTNGDGKFDKRTVFADRMMFPEGVLCYRGSVYVAAPPQIWKLTDTNHDGVADQREVWFDAKTLTGCANDLHGPYLGPDGWIYWCKGAFAEQTYARSGGDPFVTRAAHIFRRRPEGGPVEPVMTGGMDNPVEVVFTPTGERIFNTTFFQHPGNGRRDGLIHAIYGGVYGKEHGVIEGHARTGDLMPVLTHLGAAAPSGLTRLKSDGLGFRNQLLTACFNLHSVTRHKLVPEGATFKTVDSTLVSSTDLDFHPTDVIEAPDGSVLIVDTGGWYKLCCPTSQMHKPDISGGIYRLRRASSKPKEDPLGQAIEWNTLDMEKAVALLDDERHFVRQRAVDLLAKEAEATYALSKRFGTMSARAKILATWSACRQDSSGARELCRMAATDSSEEVRHAAIHAISVWRDTDAEQILLARLKDASPSVRRVAAEAIGRIGLKSAIPELMAAIDSEIDRTLEHSLIYALIEIKELEPILPFLNSRSSRQRRASLWVLHALQGNFGDQLAAALIATDQGLRETAIDLAQDHPEWGGSYRSVLTAALARNTVSKEIICETLMRLAGHPEISDLACQLLLDESLGRRIRIQLASRLTEGENVDAALLRVLAVDDEELNHAVVRNLDGRKSVGGVLLKQLKLLAGDDKCAPSTRLIAAKQLDRLDASTFDAVMRCLRPDQLAQHRSLATTVLESVKLSDDQLLELAVEVKSVGAMELSRILRIFAGLEGPEKGQGMAERLFQSLTDSEVVDALPPEQIAKLVDQFSDGPSKLGRLLLAKTRVVPGEQAARLKRMLADLPEGNVRRGQKLFHSERLACFTCHAIGYRGGQVGPDLSRIGRVRARRDLLESIVYPSMSFVRSYEPVNILTVDGEQVIGTIRNQSARQIEVQINATEKQTVLTEDIEEMNPGKVSIMPNGLDKQLTLTQLADLLAFLESRK